MASTVGVVPTGENVLEVQIAVRTDQLSAGLANAQQQLSGFGNATAGIGSQLTLFDSSLTSSAAATSELGAAVGKMGEHTVEGASRGRRAMAELERGVSESVQAIGSNFGYAGRRVAMAGEDIAKAAFTAGGLVTAAAVATTAAFAFMGYEGVKSFLELGEETLRFQRITGATAETSSLLIGVFNRFGIESGAVSQSMLHLNQAISTNAAGLEADGIVIARTKSGSVDLAETLLNVADAYHAAGAGAAGLSILQDAFGTRTATQLLPVMNLTREELKKLMDQVRANGGVLTDSDVRQAESMHLAMTNLHQAAQGLERDLVEGVVPALIALVNAAAWGIEKLIALKEALGHMPLVGGSGPGVQITDPGALNSASTEELKAINDRLRDFPKLQQQFVEGLGKEAPDAAARLAGALADTTMSAADLVTAEQALQKQQDALNKSFDGYVQSSIGADQATTAYQAGLQKLATALRDNGGSLDSNTVAGNENRQAMQDLVGQAEATAKALVAQGVAGDDVQRVLDAMAAKLLATAQAGGVSAGEAQHFAGIVTGLGNVLRALPAATSTTVTVNTAQAEAALVHLIDLLAMVDRAAAQNAARQAVINNDIPGATTQASAAISASIVAGLHQDIPAPPKPQTGGGGASGAQDAAKAAADAAKQQAQVEDSQYAHAFITEENYRGLLQARLDNAQTFSAEWFDTLGKIDAISQAHADRDAKIVAAQQQVEDNQYAHGFMFAGQYRALLQARLAGLEVWSAEWFAVQSKIEAVDQAAADWQQKLVEQQQAGVDQLHATEDRQYADGLMFTDRYKAILQARLDAAVQWTSEWFDAHERIQRIDDAAAAAAQRSADAQKQVIDQQAKDLATRRDQLVQWADPLAHVAPTWGSSSKALTSNINDQTAQLMKWSQDLDALTARGLSPDAIKLLGLGEGPAKLGQVDALLHSSDAQINALDSAVSARMSVAGARAVSEAGITPAVLQAIQAAAPTVNIQPAQISIAIGETALREAVDYVIRQTGQQTQIVGAH